MTKLNKYKMTKTNKTGQNDKNDQKDQIEQIDQNDPNDQKETISVNVDEIWERPNKIPNNFQTCRTVRLHSRSKR